MFGLRRASHEMFHGQCGKLDVNVDAVDERTLNSTSISRNLLSRAMASSAHLSGIAAGTWIHGGNQLESRREFATAFQAGEDDGARFHRFAQRFKCVARKLGEFIEKQHAEMRQRQL